MNGHAWFSRLQRTAKRVTESADNPIPVVIDTRTPGRWAQARVLADELRAPLVESSTAPVQLLVTEQRLELRVAGLGGPVAVDFLAERVAYRQRHGGTELLSRALGLRRGGRPSVIDACTGLGRDAWIMVGLGCEVELLERSPIIAALLRDGLDRAAGRPETGRMRLHRADALTWLAELPETRWPDVVFLDPMYPERTKTALPGKALRVLRAVVGDDPDAVGLLVEARRCARRRVVVKRPLRAPVLGDASPDLQYRGRSTRFDVYLTV